MEIAGDVHLQPWPMYQPLDRGWIFHLRNGELSAKFLTKQAFAKVQVESVEKKNLPNESDMVQWWGYRCKVES